MTRSPIRFPIRLKLLLLLLGVAGGTIALFAILGSESGRRAILDASTRQLASVRASKAYHVRSYLRNKTAEIQTLAQDRELLRALQRGAAPETVLRMSNLSAQLGFHDLLLVSASGDVVSSALIDPAEFPRSDHREVLATATQLGPGDARILDFEFYGPREGKPTAFVVAPIFDQGLRQGAVIALVTPDEINRIMTGGRNWRGDGLGDTGETYLVAPDGKMRSDSREFVERGRSLLRVPGNDPQRMATAQRMNELGTSVLVQPAATLAVQRAFAGEEGVLVQQGYRGDVTLCAFTTVDWRGLRYAVLSEISMDEAYAPVSDFQRQIALWAAGIIGMVALASFILSRRFVAPIDALTQATHAYSEGDSRERVHVKTSDEIGELAETFNRMIENQEQMKAVSLSLRRNIVHDLKTPVTVIKGCAETLQFSHDLAPELREELLQDVVDQSDRLLEDLRDIITPIGDDWTPQYEKFDLASLIQRAVVAERHTSRALHHRFEVEGADAPKWVVADRRKVRRVVENLLSNAVKYSPGIEKLVMIRLQTDPECVRIEVQDEGMGLDEVQLVKVMRETGRMVDETLGIEGSGFGLDSCRRVLEAHGGRLEAHSVRGKGSTFTAILPGGPPDSSGIS